MGRKFPYHTCVDLDRLKLVHIIAEYQRTELRLMIGALQCLVANAADLKAKRHKALRRQL